MKIPDIYLNTAICKNHAFPPGLHDVFFFLIYITILTIILTIQDLYKEGTFSSFEQLKQYYNLASVKFFHYLQVRYFVRKHIPDFEVLSLNPTLETIVNVHPGVNGNVLNFYKLLLEKVDGNIEKIKHDWEKEMGFKIHDNRWDECLRNVQR